MTLGETRGETREVDREAREAASALDPSPATPAAAVPPAGPSTKPKPLDAAERFDGPGVPYEHKFSTVSRGAVGVATLDGTVAADLVCWEYFYGKPCASEAERAGPEEDAARLEPWKSYVEKNDARPRPVDGVRAPSSMPSPSCDLCHAIGTADDVCRGRVREALGQVRPKKGVRARLGSAAAADAAANAAAADARGRDVVCRYGPRCDRAHPSDAEVRAKIEAWYVNSERWSRFRKNEREKQSETLFLSGREGQERQERDEERDPTRDPTFLWSVLGAGASNFRLRDAGSRAARTSAGRTAVFPRGFSVSFHQKHDTETDEGHGEEEEARVLASARQNVRRRLAKKAQTSKYVAAFLDEPFFDAILDGDPAFVRVLSHKSAHKEITEAYGARHKIQETLRGLGRDGEYEKEEEEEEEEEEVDSGAGVTIFDACSGRGVVGVLLGYFFPAAKVVMLDANGSMDLSHVAAKDNVRFEHCDLYGDSAVRAIRETIRDERREDQKTKKPPPKRRYRVLLGMHLCGALSPRLIDLAFGLDEVDGLVLCPCCVKGGLGGDCRRAAKQRNVSPYVVLCETFRRLCEEETERRDEKKKRNDAEALARRVVARADENVLSPVNGFICVAKSGPGMKSADA